MIYNFKKKKWNNFLGKYVRKHDRTLFKRGIEYDEYKRYGIFRKKFKDGSSQVVHFVDGPGADDRIEFFFFPRKGNKYVKKVVYLDSAYLGAKEYVKRLNRKKKR